MVQIGNVCEIVAVKHKLEKLRANSLIDEWDLPYENLLTRLDAAIFFLTPADDSRLDDIWADLGEIPLLNYKKNESKTLSQLNWQVQFKAELMEETDETGSSDI